MDIEVAIENKDWKFVVKYARRYGRHRGRPSREIVSDLNEYLDTLKLLELDKMHFVESIRDWLGI